MTDDDPKPVFTVPGPAPDPMSQVIDDMGKRLGVTFGTAVVKAADDVGVSMRVFAHAMTQALDDVTKSFGKLAASMLVDAIARMPDIPDVPGDPATLDDVFPDP